MKEDQLSDTEKNLFERLDREASPPKALEEQLVAALKNEGLLTKSITMNTYLKWAASLAAAVLIFLSGIFYQQSQQTVSAVSENIIIEPTRGYALLLHEDENFTPGDPMEMFNEYSMWMENTFARGVKITGQELKNEATIVLTDQISLADNQNRRTTGYFLLEADSMEEAIEVAKENPHVKYGGIVEVKAYMVR
ncbi:MAG: hypothetical protein RIM99_02395 [Cyclobacteriaceae bacterium]